MFDVINENFNSFFNDSSFSRLSIRKNFKNFVNSSITFAFDESNRIVEENDESMLKKNVIRRKVILKMLWQKIVAHKTEFKMNF